MHLKHYSSWSDLIGFRTNFHASLSAFQALSITCRIEAFHLHVSDFWTFFFLDFTSSQMIQKYEVCFNSFLSFSSRAVCCKSRSKVSSRLKKAKFRKAHLTADTSSSWPPVQPSPHKSTLYSIIGTFEMSPFSSKENALQFPDFQHPIKGQQPAHTHTHKMLIRKIKWLLCSASFEPSSLPFNKQINCTFYAI